MCQPKSRGGQRCYGYASGRFNKAHVAYLKALPPAWDRTEEMPRRAQRKLAGLEAAFIESGITMASTKRGHAEVALLAEGCARAGAQEHAGRLQHIAAAGVRQREINAQVAALARVAQSARLEYAASGGEHTDDYPSAWSYLDADDHSHYSAHDLGLTPEEYAAEQALEAEQKTWQRAKEADRVFEQFAATVGLDRLAPEATYLRSRAVAEAHLRSPFDRWRAERDAERAARDTAVPVTAPATSYREDDEHWSDAEDD